MVSFVEKSYPLQEPRRSHHFTDFDAKIGVNRLVKLQFRNQIMIELLHVGGTQSLGFLLSFLDELQKRLDENSQVLGLKDCKFFVRLVEVVQQTAVTGFREELMIGRCKLNETLEKQTLVFPVPQPDLLPCFVRVPKLAGVE